MIKAYDDNSGANAIDSIFLIPTSLSFANTWYTVDWGSQTGIKVAVAKFSESATDMVTNYEISINNSLNGYTPRNNKLKCYPYNYIYVTNNAGGSATYNYEDFTGTPTFNVSGMISTGCSIIMYPLNYKKYSNDNWKTSQISFGLNGAKYPTCSWQSDVFTNWLTQNSVNIAIDSISAATQTAGSIVTGNVPGAVGGLSQITSLIGNVYQHSLIPPQSKGNTSGGDIMSALKTHGFYAYKMSIKQEYARVIDNYFTMFGYKVNTVKIPQYTSRKYWNYIKTIDCNVDGDIPQADLQQIRSCLNNGITFWHNPANMYNYNLNNTIV